MARRTPRPRPTLTHTLAPVLPCCPVCRQSMAADYLNHRTIARVAERGCGQPGAVHGSVGIQDFTAKMADYFLIDRPAGLHEFMSDRIGLDEMCSECDEYSADSRLAACDATGEAEI